MMPRPMPWDDFRPGLFRLSGYGGAGLFLRSGVLNGEVPQLVVDVGFLTPTEYLWFLRRPMTREFSEDLARFFFACADDLRPQVSVAPVHDPLCGLQVRVLSSTDTRAELEFAVDGDGVDFETSRVALTRAAEDVRVLESAVGDHVIPLPPMDW